ncbi:MAG: succinate dehydrogenase/fumarate reductase iron-sulfur subunit [Planctomycetia bacterium]
MELTLRIWRQAGPSSEGRLESYTVKDVSPDMSFLEMLDLLNEGLLREGKAPVAFEHDCREGICGSCGMMVNGAAHGPKRGATTCQLHMRSFRDGDTITIEPWRAGAFPVLKDLVVDRSAFDRIVQAGGYISTNAGSAPDANAVPIPKADADRAMDAAACIGCGACVAACPNAAAMLFTAAKVAHLGRLPQGKPEADKRVIAMVETMEAEGFGGCTNHYECMEACPKEIDVRFIAEMNRLYVRAKGREEATKERSGDG